MVIRRTEELDVVVEMPESLPLTSDEFALIETYMRSIVVELIRLEADNDNDTGQSTGSPKDLRNRNWEKT
tara:strand:- start:417 stop:626 length:210 start_codon:yes stop_codon:yes gene_type:complete